MNDLEEYKPSITETVDKAINNKVDATSEVKEVIDLAATHEALKEKDTVDKIITEKKGELTYDAERKKLEAESKKISEEAEKVRKSREKELEIIQTQIDTAKAELQDLIAQDDKASAYYNANKSILKCIGVREKLTLRAMQRLMPVASIAFVIFQILLFPFTIIGFAAEQLITIISNVCGSFAKGGWKIVITILTGIIIVGLIFGLYYVAVHYAGELFIKE